MIYYKNEIPITQDNILSDKHFKNYWSFYCEIDTLGILNMISKAIAVPQWRFHRMPLRFIYVICFIFVKT